MTKTLLRCGRNNPHRKGKDSDGGSFANRSGVCGVEIISAPKLYSGNENGEGQGAESRAILRGTDCRPGAFLDGRDRPTIEGWYVIEREDTLDEIFVRTIDGPFITEQEAERVAGWRRRVDADDRVSHVPPTIEAPELVSAISDDVFDLIATKWEEVAA